MSTFITTITASLLLAISLQSSAQIGNQNSESFESVYQTESVTGMSLDKRALLGGVVVSSSKVNISAQVPGDVLSVSGREGDVFNTGDLLITLEQDSIKAQRDSAYAEIASANESLRNAGVQYSRSIVSPNSSSMFGGMPSMFSMFTDPMLQMSGQGNPEFDKFAKRTSRFTEYQQAKNRLKQAELKLKEAEEKLKDANILAPFDGVIIEKHVSTGDVVQPGQVLLMYSNIKSLQVEVNIPSRLIRSLQLEKQYRIKLDIANTVVNATLSQVYPIADDTKHSVKVKFDIPSGVPVLPGAYAEVELFQESTGNLTPVISEAAIIWRSSLPSVFVIDPVNNRTELRFIRLGEQIGADKKSVLSGLKIGEKIVTNPNILMVSGMSI
ncbi:MAG TPA: efflux RND transporter periplasmic adaptor subunit [Candidatus Thioglobus sp.]|jgi:multidrug efflux pump subunit AcrA (membrane-fusion protein)|nr:efflux RND transporter periplasmic adaptor subunit [Candidatus Thioglobus sp.]